MKKIIKRLLTGFLALATVCTSLPASPVMAQERAKVNGTVKLEKHTEYTYEFDDSFPAPFNKKDGVQSWWTYKMNVNNSGTYRQVYCIEYGTPANTGDTYVKQGNEYDRLSAGQKKLLGRALMFGYNDSAGSQYQGTWLENVLATQTMVWVITGGQYGTSWEKKIVDRLLADSAKAKEIYYQIKANMESYNTIPSFTASSESKAKDYELKYNMNNGKYELSLTDSNNVLKYFDFSSSGIEVQRSGNKLNLSSGKPFDTKTLKANKNLPKDELPAVISGAPEYWFNQTQQNFASLDIDGSRENVPAYFKLHTEKVGHVKLVKTSDDGVVANLKFQISGNGMDRTYTTDEKGEILMENLVAGEYTITEVDTPNKYVQPKTQVVTVKPAQTTAVSFDNVLKKFHIYITKSDEETGSTPQGDATLGGAEYDIYNAQGDFIEHIKADGNVAKSSLLPLGTYKIYETVPPTGYTLNEEPMTVTGDFDGQTVEVGRADTGISDRVIKGQVAVTKFADKPLTGDTDDGGIKQPLEGIEFTLTLKSTGEEACKIVTDADGYAITPMLPYGTYRIEETKGADGYRVITPFDIVIDQNGKIYKYILENTVYETDVKIVKKDAETGKVIPLAGTQFKIKDSAGNWVTQKYNYPTPTVLDTFETAQDGTLVLPEPLRAGSYELHEVKAPNGYTLSKEPVPFTVSAENPSTMLEVVCNNQPVKGKVTIEKLGERFTGADFRMTEYGKLFTPIYELQGLEGISFDIVASEDITTPDGTIRYEAGTVVDTITTGADGKATSKPLYLGKYQAVEKNTLDGFVLDGKKYGFELTYKDQNTEIVTTSMQVENTRQKARVSLYKEFESLCNQEYSPLSSVLFGVYAKEDILTASGTVGIEKGSLVDVFAVDEAGSGVMNTDIPAGSYYVKELATGNGYILSDKEYPFEFQHMGTEVPVIAIHVNDGKPIENKLMRGDLEIIKTSEDNKVEGIRFKVVGEIAVGTEYEEIFQTDKDGKIHIKDLPVGEYTVSEVADDKTVGYLTPKSQTVKVENGTTSTVEFENLLQRGGIKIEKSAEGETDLSRFAFEISGTSLTGVDYKEVFKTDKDGVIEVKDLLVGEYTVKELANDKTEGFVLPADQTVSVQHGATAEVKVENQKIRGDVEITKKSDDGKLLEGVVFGIFTKDGDKVLDITTDKDGKALAKNLEYGDYYLQEQKTIDGYKLNDKKFSFSVKEDGEVIQIEVINDKIVEVPKEETPDTPTTSKQTDSPKTGDNAKTALFAGLLALSGAGLAGAYFFKRRRDKKS